MKELTLAQKSQLHDYKRIKKSGNREEVSFICEATLNNKKNIQETYSRNLNGNKVKNLVGKTKEIKSKEGKLKEKKRPKSSEFPRRLEFLEKVDSEKRENQKKISDEDNFWCCCCCCCWRVSKPKCSSLVNLDSRTWSGCGADTSEKEQSEPWTIFNHFSRSRRKYGSNSNFSKTVNNKIFYDEKEFCKVKRSLRLLGFELSDFGIESSWEENPPKKKAKEKSASFSTKITSRSMSLDSLRTAVKRAWRDDCLDESYRKVLAQAAYEEWYFKKEKELWLKRNKEKLIRLKAKENLRDHFERKKEKSQEEFRKWLNEKRTKRKKKERNQKNSPDRLLKTKEESEKAFLKWKKTKEEELEKKKKEKEKEEERKLKSEKEKNEKKIMAEKAFEMWAAKANQTINSKEVINQKQKKRQEMEERRKRKKGRQISFEMWKAVKDEQTREKTRNCRVACKIAREESLAQMEERMYEAEQAFEDWLEKVEARKQKHFPVINDYNKMIPWIPV